jgi:hypothetical protein
MRTVTEPTTPVPKTPDVADSDGNAENGYVDNGAKPSISYLLN